MNDISWSKFIEVLENMNEAVSVMPGVDPGMIVCGLTYDSREVHEGTLFVCKGAAFRKDFLLSAIEKGACAYVSEIDYEVDLPHVIVNDIRKVMPELARTYYHFPEEELHRIGLTGTAGKTTTAYSIKNIYDVYLKSLGEKPMAIFSSVELDDGTGVEIAPNQTTPEAMELYRRFQNAYDSGRKHLVMEVSSQALKYDRTIGIPFDVGVFVNISNDHISPLEHSSFEDYISAKLKIFSQVKTAVLNMDSDHIDRIMAAAGASERIVTYAQYNNDADYVISNIREGCRGLEFTITGPDFTEDFTMPMIGLFNAMNALAAVAVCHSQGIPVSCCVEGISRVTVPGHMEMHVSPDGNIKTIVDYAHNGLSFETVYRSAREVYPDHKLVTVFGCSGGKALNRREDEGRAAGKHCDLTYVTMDYPDMETVWDISCQIGKGVESEGGTWIYVEDRIDAIKKAVTDSEGPTVICILGRGAEQAQKIHHELIPYPSDGEIIEQVYEELYK